MTTPAPIDPVDAIHLLRTYLLHCRLVRRSLHHVAHELERRAECHDDSKLLADELAGFSRINKHAREHPYGSPEYLAGLTQERPTIEKHYARNSHHPEFHDLSRRVCHEDDVTPKASTMSWLDLIEMVCDWRGAWEGYGKRTTWEAGVAYQKQRFASWFTESQWWLIDQVANALAEV